ncbi:MAG: D-alanyl-D-alanine carboxypeptidase family protein [Clostridia bacterium]
MVLLPLIINIFHFQEKTSAQETATFYNKSSSSCVIERKSGQVLCSTNKDIPLEMASTTKIMTAIVVIENSDIEREILIPRKAVGVEGSSIYLKENEKWKIKDLLFGLMLRSGNDAATALAIATGGNLEGFVKMMNDKAQALKLSNTRFANPHGLHDSEHFTTAFELAKISAYAMRNSIFREIVGAKSYTTEENSTRPRQTFVNKNKMLNLMPGGNGIKTGYTTQAGRCLVSSCCQGDMELICVVLNHGDMWQDSINYMQGCFAKFAEMQIGKANEILYSLSTEKEKMDIALKNDISLPIEKGSKLNLSYKFKPLENLRFPLQKGQEIGYIYIYNANHLLFSEKIITMNTVKDKGVILLFANLVGNGILDENEGKIEQIFSIKRSCIAQGR